MSLTLYFHPLSSYCWKALIGLYELEVPFEKHLVDLSNPAERDAFARIWPLAKFPVLRDGACNRTLPESTIILEYVDGLAAGPRHLIPSSAALALQCRLQDRLYDLYIHQSMQKIVADRLRPADARDALGVEQARAQLESGYALADDHVRLGPWAMGAEFTLADCAAMPALFYANKVAPFVGRWKNLTAYLERLEARPSAARVLREAMPYMHAFPG
jgi:glutathione S-transferase